MVPSPRYSNNLRDSIVRIPVSHLCVICIYRDIFECVCVLRACACVSVRAHVWESVREVVVASEHSICMYVHVWCMRMRVTDQQQMSFAVPFVRFHTHSTIRVRTNTQTHATTRTRTHTHTHMYACTHKPYTTQGGYARACATHTHIIVVGDMHNTRTHTNAHTL